MKKLLNKTEKKPILISIGLLLFQSFTYLFIKIFQGTPHMIGNSIDDKIQFNSLFIIFYYSWYILIFYLPYYFYKRDKNQLAKYLACYVISLFVSCIIFVIYPTQVLRPTIDNSNIFNILTNLVYFVDNPPINCFPSMHCAISMLITLSIFTTKKSSKKMKCLILILSILIMLSTVFVKQHVVIDIISGDILMTIIYLIVNNNKKIVNKTKKVLNI